MSHYYSIIIAFTVHWLINSPKNGGFLKMMTDLAEILKINKNGAEHFILF